MLLQDSYLRDERPAKRRRVDYSCTGVARSTSKAFQTMTFNTCSICKQALNSRQHPGNSCPQCQNVCCANCMSLCNASFFVNLAATPPLCDSDSPSLSSTPTRYDTPEPFNPDLLRARLMAAAASLHTLSSQDDSPSSTTETSAGNTNKIIKKRRRSVENNPCAEEKLGSGVSSYAPSASYHHHHPHDTRQVCPSGCSSKFCINCLVETADGHKTCLNCLEDSFP